MAPSELEQYLYEKIPLSRAIQISAIEVNEHTVRLRAPLTPNLNHRATVFGGSAVAVAILSVTTPALNFTSGETARKLAERYGV